MDLAILAQDGAKPKTSVNVSSNRHSVNDQHHDKSNSRSIPLSSGNNWSRSVENIHRTWRPPVSPVLTSTLSPLMDPSPPQPPHHPYSHLWSVNKDVRLMRDQEREKAEQERERLEKLRGAEQAVDKHFEESLRPQRLAQHKQRSSSWNLPSFPANARVVEDPSRMRDRYFPPQPAPVLHPHTRMPLSSEPPSQPPFNMFGYPGFPLPVGMLKQDSIHPVSAKLPTPPPIISDVKNSVIVKNDNKKRERERNDRTSPALYRTSPALLIEAQNLQRPVYPTYTHQPAPKVKVSSPAPSHIYGKPSSKPPLSTSPYQQMPTHHPPPVSTKLPPPPPAHSGVGSSVFITNCDTSSVQSQPLDLGISLTKSDSPKRKVIESFVEESNDVSPAKKVCISFALDPSEAIPLQQYAEVQQQPLSLSNTPSNMKIEPQLPTNFSIESQLNTNPSTENQFAANLSSESSVSEPTASSDIPVNTTTSSNSTQQSNTSSHVSTSPNPTNNVSKQESSSVGAHKLKKAWLQRHSGVESTTPPPATPTPPPATPPPAAPTPPLQTVLANVASPALSVRSTPPLQPTPTTSNVASPATSVRSTPPPIVSSTPPPNFNINGHTSPAEDSSSSDSESAKRVSAKVKRKKKNGNDGKKTASSTESDKESDSRSDSGGKKANGNSPTKSSVNSGGSSKKRGRKTKDSSEENNLPLDDDGGSNQKKSRDMGNGPPHDPFQKPSVSTLKRTGESFLQDGPCFEVAPKLAKCRECRWTPNQRSRNNANIFCRFYAFRRLRYTKNSQLAIAGFSDPYKDAAPEDVKLWLPDSENPPSDIDLELSDFILRQVASQFFELLYQEEEALEMNMSEDNFVAWKRVVQGVREMCDVCETTLFNFHWTCSKCGFVVCIDCYRDRKLGHNKSWGDGGRDRVDDASWLLCNNRQPHEQEKLMLTQIIASDSLLQLKNKMKEYKKTNNIPIYFTPPEKKLKAKTEEEKSDSPLEWLADVALKKQEGKQQSSNNSDSTSTNATPAETEGGNPKESSFSTLRKLLIRSTETSDESGTKSQESAEQNTESTNEITSATVKTESTTDNENNSDVKSPNSEVTVKEETTTTATDEDDGIKLEFFIRSKDHSGYNAYNRKGIRILAKTESKRFYPEVPHTWLGDGKILILTDPPNPANYKLFQEMWRRGQPVLVSGVGAQLNQRLWHPDSFAEDFGDLRHDFINCVTGNVVPNQSMRKFWEGFEVCNKRLKDDKGQGMLLKLKDWPPSDDFAELLPTRFSDLMKVLPLGEYTQRSGRLNLAARLPECFVKPDLGPKMYIAYGNSSFPSKATTNLHLDVSDAVNLMVYVGIPKDGDHSEYMREAYRAIDEGGSDLFTRRRVRTKGELPGALWHIFAPEDADKIRDCLNKVAMEKGVTLQRNHDSIHDQSWYLDQTLRDRLYYEYKVQPYTIVQCLGDAVFVPAGAPHQVRNLHSCIKIAEDFVSPENVSHCFHLTQEFRELSDTHSNHEDKLQIKNIIYHAVKDSLSVVQANEAKVKVETASTVMPASTTANLNNTTTVTSDNKNQISSSQNIS